MPSTHTHQEARPWAKAIKEEVLERRMPPWHAVAGYGEFANDPSLAGREIDFITAWVDGGAPKGDDKDLVPLPDFEKEWALGTPDLILTASHPGSTTVDENDELRCFVFQNPSRRTGGSGRLISSPAVAAWCSTPSSGSSRPEVRTGLLLRTRSRDAAASGRPSFRPSRNLGSWIAGQDATVFCPGCGPASPGRTRLVIQVRYQKTAGEPRELNSVGLYFAKRTVKKRLRSVSIENPRFEIPPGAESFRVKAAHTSPARTRKPRILPHMHLLGKLIQVAAVRPDSNPRDSGLGAQRTILTGNRSTISSDRCHFLPEPGLR